MNTGTGLQRKVWSKLSAIRPLELKNQIRTSTKGAVPVVDEAMMNKLQGQQRLLWSSHVKEQRLEETRMQLKSVDIPDKHCYNNPAVPKVNNV